MVGTLTRKLLQEQAKRRRRMRTEQRNAEISREIRLRLEQPSSTVPEPGCVAPVVDTEGEQQGS